MGRASMSALKRMTGRPLPIEATIPVVACPVLPRDKGNFFNNKCSGARWNWSNIAHVVIS
jgi:hypothetical protein